MLGIIFKQTNKPTLDNFYTLSRIAYELTGLEFYNNYASNYFSTEEKNNFFTQFWILRKEVQQLIK